MAVKHLDIQRQLRLRLNIEFIYFRPIIKYVRVVTASVTTP